MTHVKKLFTGRLRRVSPSREAVWQALGNVIDPELRRPVTELE